MPAAIPLAIAAATAVGSLGAAKLSSNASSKAATLETNAANHAADIQSKSAADALAFQKAQAAQDLVTANATQKANYDQWAAKQGRLSKLSALTGGGTFDIPAYSPIPTSGAPTGAPAPTQAPPAPAAPPSYTTSMANVAIPNGGSYVSRTQQAGAGMPTGGQDNRIVMMKAPNGMTKGVPGALVSHYQQMGATVIG